MCLYLENLPAAYMPKAQGSTWQHKVYLIAGESPSQMEMMKVQLFQGAALWVLLSDASATTESIGPCEASTIVLFPFTFLNTESIYTNKKYIWENDEMSKA